MNDTYSSRPSAGQRRPAAWQRLVQALPASWQRMFNLNDPRWGRTDQDSERPAGSPDPQNDERPPQPPQRPQPDKRPENGPPDLDELWQDLNRKLGGLFGGSKGGQQGGGGAGGGGGGGGGFPGWNRGPDGGNTRGTRIGVGLIAGVLLVMWLLSGFFIVQEGQQAVVTRFGSYRATVGAGINWILPFPIERHETVNVTQIRSVDIGGENIIQSTGLRESAMLTSDENIVEINFAVQYRLSNARDYLFASRNPDQAVIQAAETAVREVIGSMRMDAALAEEREQIAPRVRQLMQQILDRYQVGIDVVGVNLQQGGVRPPEQVQAAFDDVLKAGQEAERAKNEAQAYANRVVPLATGTASRLRSEAEAYKSQVVAQAEGDSSRFSSILPEYQKAPQATRDRMYNDTMKDVYSKVTKILVDAKQGSMLYLPLDKILQNQGAAATTGTTAAPAARPAAPATETPAPAAATSTDARARDADRSRER